MSIAFRDEHRTHAIAALAAAGCREGTDWRWADSPVPLTVPLLLDGPDTIEVHDWGPDLGEPLTPVILVRASAVRKLGGPRCAAAMETGELPRELPYATFTRDLPSLN